MPNRSARQTFGVTDVAAAAAVIEADVKDSRLLRQDWGEEHVDVAWQHVRTRWESGESSWDQVLFRRQECCG